MISLWEHTAKLPRFDTLRGDINTDVLVIGGGIAGILCAYMLGQAGVDYVLAEAQTVCSGITKNTTAKVTSQHGLIYADMLRRFGAEKTRQYIDANELALEKYREICEKTGCEIENRDSYVYSTDDRAELERELSALLRIGVDAQFAERLPLPFDTAGAVEFKNQAQIHPLKFIGSIVHGLNIFEHTAVRELVGTTAITDHGRIKARKIIVATHFPFINKHGSYFIKMYQHRSYVIALEDACDMDGMYVDASESGLSFRSHGRLLLLGGGSHRTGKKGGGWQELRDFARVYYPASSERYHWAAQDCMTLDSIPYIGRYSSRTEDMYVAAGFNKWGMTSSMTAAMILCDMVQGKANRYEAVFSPSRSILRPQLAVNAAETAVNLLTPTVKRCPHLGCALKWNPTEHTWDCPCHGSRFTKDGKLIDNPATDGLK